MAIDIQSICDTAEASSSSQSLAIILSVMFSIYTLIAIALSALTIYSTSSMPSMAGKPAATATYAGDGLAAPLVALVPGRS